MAEINGKAHQLLIISYDDGTNRAMAKLLRIGRYQVCIAKTLGEGEQVVSAQPIDLVLCRMTASDGDAAEFIERMFERYHVPSVAVSGSIELQSRAARLSPEAMRGILWMPISVPIMYLAITRALAHSRNRVGVCPDCYGQGTVPLLTSKRRCRRCDGSGLESQPVGTGAEPQAATA